MDYQIKYQIIRQIILIAQRWQDRADRVVKKELGLTTKQWMLLSTLDDEFEDHLPTLSELTESVGTSRQNIKRLVVELQKKEYLIIANDPKDHRVLRIALTGKHREFFQNKKNKQLIELLTDEYFNKLDETRIYELERAVSSIYDQIIETK